MTAVYLQLAAYACATTFSPGPNNILLFSSTSRYGIRKCWPLIFGIWAGLITVMPVSYTHLTLPTILLV